MTQDILWKVTLAAVMTGWVLFAAAFFARRRPQQSKEKKRVSSSFAAIGLQGLGFAAAWSLRRTPFTPIVAMRMPLQVLMALVALTLTAAGVWLVSAAVRTLGKQWALVAHVVEDHQLITEGPYRIVRHPIYSGMFMMMIATGLVVGHWIGLVVGVVMFLAGTMWRVGIEEKLLTETFGAAYTAYRQQVPALFPWKGRGRG